MSEQDTKRKGIEVTVDIDPDLIDDILVGAFEGGSNYWIDSVDVEGGEMPEGVTWYSHCLTRGKNLLIHVSDDDDSPHVLTLEKMVLGIYQYGRKYYGALPMTLETEGGFYQHFDADVADTIVQLALFDEVVYG